METTESRSFLDKGWVESEQANPALIQVHEGMRVYDRTGRKLGTVEAVYWGDIARQPRRVD